MSKKPTPLQRAIKIVGGQTKLAERLGCSQQLISKVDKTDMLLRYEYAVLIEAMTNGQVTASQLRPDVHKRLKKAGAA